MYKFALELKKSNVLYVHSEANQRARVRFGLASQVRSRTSSFFTVPYVAQKNKYHVCLIFLLYLN
jgi:hypothetical protein